MKWPRSTQKSTVPARHRFEESLTRPDVTNRVASNMAERVTRRFYKEFRKRHAAFLKFITGIPNQGDHEWYASMMLNRLMFLYFVQKKGFLDGDVNYLSNRLQKLKAEHGGQDKFYSFYRNFLLKLFHGGLNKRLIERDPGMEQLLGRVPYLNGGIFDVHTLERTYGDSIQIPDTAFEAIFAYFNEWEWHLDERPLRSDKEINPDVLGYIFEKHINQKQMGAYYTKEDTTEYIGKNTIIPFLFDAVQGKVKAAFEGAASVWSHLQTDPDRYIYKAVRHGVSWDYQPDHPEQGLPLAEERPLPDDIAAGLDPAKPDLLERRKPWNKPAPATHGLPTEIWRETIARRQRCAELRNKLAAGEVRDINDFITLNLDVRQFIQDVIERCDSPELLAAFWHSLAGRSARKSKEKPRHGITILDPTCGSGAFLFAALNILEPIYEACLDRMEGLLADARATNANVAPESHLAEFESILERVECHPNKRYFISRTIILHNLYGVDLMEEAVEICKLRLFLKLAAQVEPNCDDANLGIELLPDIDFNIRSGNTIVGYATRAELATAGERDRIIEEEVKTVLKTAGEAASACESFIHSQFEGENPAALKCRLLGQFSQLREKCDRFLAESYEPGIAKNSKEFPEWKCSHQPFHWLIEFFGILDAGGFNIIIGNPPYVAASEARKSYTPPALATTDCSDIYAWVLERSQNLLCTNGRTGMIVPLSLGFSSDFSACRRLLFAGYSNNWFSSFGRIPSALFGFDVRVRNTIHLALKSKRPPQAHTTRLHRWFDASRPTLFHTVEYAPFEPALWKFRIPKLNTPALARALEYALSITNRTLDSVIAPRQTKHLLHFKKTAYNWLNFCRNLPPCYDGDTRVVHTQFGDISFRTAEERDLGMLLCNGKLMFVFWATVCDDFHVTHWSFEDFPIDLDSVPTSLKRTLIALLAEMEEAMNQATQFKLNAGKNIGNYNLAKCRHVTDKADLLFCEAIGLASVWEEIELYCAQVVKTDFDEEQ